MTNEPTPVRMTDRMMDDIEAIPSEDLIGMKVRFVLKPETTSQITCVHLFRAGRTLSVAYWEAGEAKTLDCDDFQVEIEP